MNIFIPFTTIRHHFLSGLAICACLLAASKVKAEHPGLLDKSHWSTSYDTLLVNKYSENKNYSVRIFQDVEKKFLLVSVDNSTPLECHFFMFDMDGKLVTKADISSQEITIFEHIKKGNYFFEIFNQDERIENGKLSVR